MESFLSHPSFGFFCSRSVHDGEYVSHGGKTPWPSCDLSCASPPSHIVQRTSLRFTRIWKGLFKLKGGRLIVSVDAAEWLLSRTVDSCAVRTQLENDRDEEEPIDHIRNVLNIKIETAEAVRAEIPHQEAANFAQEESAREQRFLHWAQGRKTRSRKNTKTQQNERAEKPGPEKTTILNEENDGVGEQKKKWDSRKQRGKRPVSFFCLFSCFLKKKKVKCCPASNHPRHACLNAEHR
jgi:hypothetical protein